MFLSISYHPQAMKVLSLKQIMLTVAMRDLLS
jgi:hypothetical protein